MPESLAKAYIAHELPGRLRLKVPDKRGNAAYFAAVMEGLTKCAGVKLVDANALTGSLLVHLAPGNSSTDIADFAEINRLFLVSTPPAVSPQTLLQHARSGAELFDRSLSELSGGYLDLPSALFLSMIALSIRQASQGQIFGPAFAMAWNAFELAYNHKIRPE